MSLQRTATIVSSFTAFLLVIIKFFVGIFSWSIAVLSSAIDSMLDMFVSIFNYFAIYNSEKDPDKKFNYGRWKIEALASFFEWLIISISWLYIFYESISKIINDEKVSYLGISIIVMLISIFITWILVLFLNYVSKKTDNLVIKADALHYKTDLYSNAWILLWLWLIYFLGIYYIDSIIWIIIAIYIVYSAYWLIKKWFLFLLDVSLKKDEVDKIKKIIEKQDKVKSFHELRTRQAGNIKFVEAHIVFDMDIKLLEANKISDIIEIEISKINKDYQWIITMHLDPFDDSETNNKKLQK